MKGFWSLWALQGPAKAEEMGLSEAQGFLGGSNCRSPAVYRRTPQNPNKTPGPNLKSVKNPKTPGPKPQKIPNPEGPDT